MQKIPTLLVRDRETNLKYVKPEIALGCEWVFAGEGVATRKYDGACCMVEDGKLYKRRELRKGDKKPAGFREVNHDRVTLKTIGWVPVGDGPEDRWFVEAWESYHRTQYAFGKDVPDPPEDGTYELIGPKVQGNPEKADVHTLVPHGQDELLLVPRDVDELMVWVASLPFEGVVFHHPDGRMAKLKKRDIKLTSQQHLDYDRTDKR